MFGNHLFITYTIIFIVLQSVNLYMWFHQKMKNKPVVWILILIFLPIIFCCLYMAFAMIYMVADMLYGDRDILVVHIITNIPNLYTLYLLVRTIKDNKQK